MSNYPQTYFKTIDAFNKAVQEQNGKTQDVNCAHGNSHGAIVYNADSTISHYLVFCKACYNEATYQQRGE